MEILAAISDDNIPIQPEGNTQQLNDFDKVYIQLKRRNTSLIAGDYELKRPDSYFMNFFKRTQGGSVSTSFKSRKDWQYNGSLSAAIAKGRSTRNSFIGIEGNQGPYRLTGNNGEQYIIILSGTERVYLDGQLLLRGQENDYVINYNTAEITFTPKRLITLNSRIIIEFEYSDKNYARTLSYLNQEISNKRVSFKFNFYNEQDNRNQPFQQDLTTQQKQFLKTIGNQIDQAYFPNVDTVTYNTNEILYKKIDTLGATGVFVYSINPDLAKYRPGFTFLGPNKGNYTLNTNSSANGRVFEFIPPINGIKQGNYEPITLLITPKKQQLLTFSTDYKAGKNTVLSNEFAYSNHDLNLFSSINEDQNKGFAYKFLFKNQLDLSASDSASLKLLTGASYEFTTLNFKAIERYRAVEFERDFNILNTRLPSSEQIAGFNLGLFKKETQRIDYGFTGYFREKNYSGFQHRLNSFYQTKNYRLSYWGNILTSSSITDKGNFFRQKADVSRLFNTWLIGINLDQERNKTQIKESQVLSPLSFAFTQYKFYVDKKSDKGNNLHFEYNRRYDKLPFENKLSESSIADVFQASYEMSKNANSHLSFTSSYRHLNYNNRIAKQDESSFLGRTDYSLTMLKGFINTDIFYEVGSGQEAKREFTYLEVQAGQGIYTWNDYNNNSIKELNEFEIANYPDQAKYIRIFRLSNEFNKTNYTTINQTLRLTPLMLLKDKRGLLKFLAKISTQTAIKIDRKILDNSNLSAFNPFDTRINESELISLNSFFRNTLFFERNNPVFGVDFNYQTSANKTLLTNGFDTRNKKEAGIRIRWNFIQKFNLIFELNQGNKKYSSELFTQKNYAIGFAQIKPQLNYQFNNNFRLTFTGGFTQQKNKIQLGGEKNLNYNFSTESRYNILKKGILTSSINLVYNDFRGLANSSIAYDMLEGLQSGKNLVWNTGLQHTVANGIQLNFNYQGRKSADVKIIHTGSIQARAFF